MRNLASTVFSLSLFVLASSVLLIPSFEDEARAQSCSIGICKSAPGAGDIQFPFQFVRGGEISVFELTAGSECLLRGLDPTLDVTITEDVLPGWDLADIECEGEGLEISPFPNGIFVQCLGPGGGGVCTFINVPEGTSLSAIPTLSEWGMIAAAGAMLLAGAFYAVRRRRLAA